MAMRFSLSSLRGSMIEVVIPVIVEENDVVYIPSEACMQLETELIPILLAVTIQTILPRLEIRKPFGSRKSNIVSALLRKNEEATTGIQGPKNIPPKPVG